MHHRQHQAGISDHLLPPSPRSRWGLNAANFLFAEVVSVFLPFLAAFLKLHHWPYDRIETATAVSGIGSLLFHTPAGILTDRIESRRLLLGSSTIFLGLVFACVPLAADQDAQIYMLLFLFGVAGTFIVPTLATLALSLVGHGALNRILGENQRWNHLGGIAGSLIALYSVRYFGIESIFYMIAGSCLLAASSLLLVSSRDLSPERELSVEKQGDRICLHGMQHLRPNEVYSQFPSENAQWLQMPYNPFVQGWSHRIWTPDMPYHPE